MEKHLTYEAGVDVKQFVNSPHWKKQGQTMRLQVQRAFLIPVGCEKKTNKQKNKTTKTSSVNFS